VPTGPDANPKRHRGRPRKQPITVDEKVVAEPIRLRGGKAVGSPQTVIQGEVPEDHLRIAKTLLNLFADQAAVLAKATTTVGLVEKGQARGSEHPPSSLPTSDTPPHRWLMTDVESKPSMVHPTMNPSASSPRAVGPPIDTQMTQRTPTHGIPESITRIPSNTPLPQLQVPVSRSPTPRLHGGDTSATYGYPQFTEFLRPAIRVLKRHYRQSNDGGPAQPISPHAVPIPVDPTYLQDACGDPLIII